MKRFAAIVGALGVLVGLLASPAAAVAGFGDVDGDDYWTDAVQWMVDHEITTGTGPGCFSPDDPVTRGQAAAFLWRMAGRPAVSTSHPFTDVTASWQTDAVSWMAVAGVTTGTSARTYSPSAVLTRGQFAALLHRLAGSPAAAPAPFADVDVLWQTMAVGWLSAAGITTGVDAARFAPDDIVTRGQLATFLYRFGGEPAVTVSGWAPPCAYPETGLRTSAADCAVRADASWSPVWFDLYYRDGPSVCARPVFVGPGRTIVVDAAHPLAADGNSGTETAPLATVVHAATVARAGDVVLVKGATYDDGPIKARADGVVFSAFPGHEGRVVVVRHGFDAHRVSNVILHGFTFRDMVDNAIIVSGPAARNIVIAANEVDGARYAALKVRGVFANDDPGDFDGVRDLLVIGNRFHDAVLESSEVISVGNGAVNVDIVANELSGGPSVDEKGHEGIAFKEGVRDSRIYGNDIYGLTNRGIHIDGGEYAWDALVADIEIFDNVTRGNGNQGLWVTTEGRGDVDGVYIHDNVAIDNATDGFLVYAHPDGEAAGGTVRNIVLEHNIAVGNGDEPWFGGFKVDSASATGVVLRDNISWANNGADMSGEATTVFDQNLCAADVCAVRRDPMIARLLPEVVLAPGSPAAGAASDGTDLGVR